MSVLHVLYSLLNYIKSTLALVAGRVDLIGRFSSLG